MEKLLTVRETAKLLNVNVDKVYELIKKGHLPALKLGSMKIPPWVLKDFVDRNIGIDLSDLDQVKQMDILNQNTVNETIISN